MFSALRAKPMRASQILRSAFALMFSTIASSALGMVFWIVAARLFSTQEVGRASAGVSAISLVGGLGQLGLSSVLIRFVPLIGGAVGRFLRRTYLASTSVSLLLAIGFVGFGFGNKFLGSGVLWGVAFCVAVLGACVSSLQDGVLTALKRTSWVPVENVAIAVGRLLLLPALIATAFVNPVLIAWGLPMIGAVVVITVALFGRLLPKHERMHAGRVRMPSRRDLIQFTGAGYANGLLGNLTTYLPPVIITAVLGPSANAVFFVPWLIGTVIYGLLWNIASSFVVEATSDAAHTGTHLRHATRLVLLVGIGGTVSLVVGAPWFLQLLGRDYSTGGAMALRLVGLSVPFGCITLVYTVSLLMQRKNWAIFRLSLVSSVLSLPLAVASMHRFGINGVVGGFLVSDAIIALCLLPTVIRRYRALANRSIDDDVTMVVDFGLLRAQLREEDSTAGAPAGAVAQRADDETTVLDLAALRAELQQHNPVSFTPALAQWSRANDETVVLDARAVQAAGSAQDETAVLVRVTDAGPADAPSSAETAVLARVTDAAPAVEAAGIAGGGNPAPVPRQASRHRPRHAAEAAVAAPAAAPDAGQFGWFAGDPPTPEV